MGTRHDALLFITTASAVDLKVLLVAISDRQSLAAIAALSFSVGDTVRVNDQCRPMKFIGATGTVSGLAGNKLVVTLDSGGDLRVPGPLLDKA